MYDTLLVGVDSFTRPVWSVRIGGCVSLQKHLQCPSGASSDGMQLSYMSLRLSVKLSSEDTLYRYVYHIASNRQTVFPS